MSGVSILLAAGAWFFLMLRAAKYFYLLGRAHGAESLIMYAVRNGIVTERNAPRLLEAWKNRLKP